MNARDVTARVAGPGTLAWMLQAQAEIARESGDKWGDLDRILALQGRR